MGQKTNPTVLRIGKIKEWDLKYLEKKSTELPFYSFINLEIEKFLITFFENNGLSVHKCKLSFSETSLHIFVSYFSNPKLFHLINLLNKEQQVKLKFKKLTRQQQKNLNLLKKNRKYTSHPKKNRKYTPHPEKNRKYTSHPKKNRKYTPHPKKNRKYTSHPKKNRKYTSHPKKNLNLLKKNLRYTSYSKKNLNKNLIKKYNKTLFKYFYFKSKFQRLTKLNDYKIYKSIKKYKNFNHLNLDLFLVKIIKTINLFYKKQLNIFFTFEQLSSNINSINFLNNRNKKILNFLYIKLRKFQQTKFFKNGIFLLYICIKNSSSSQLLANYIKFYLKKLKKHNFFLAFLKNVLNLFIHKNFSKLKQIKIKIKGRLNGAPRAKNRVIELGKKKIPILTINNKIDYFESTSYTANGTLGIKVWTNKKL